MDKRITIGALLFAMALTGCAHRPRLSPFHQCMDALDARWAAGDRVTTVDVSHCATKVTTCTTDSDCGAY